LHRSLHTPQQGEFQYVPVTIATLILLVFIVPSALAGEYQIMTNAFIDARKNRPGSGGHVGDLMVFADEGFHGANIIELHDGREFDFFPASPRIMSMWRNPQYLEPRSLG
jgi:hypothetical protein